MTASISSRFGVVNVLFMVRLRTPVSLHLTSVNAAAVQVIPVSYTVWDRVGISGQGLHHEVNQQSWLRSEMLKRGVTFPVRVTQ